MELEPSNLEQWEPNVITWAAIGNSNWAKINAWFTSGVLHEHIIQETPIETPNDSITNFSTAANKVFRAGTIQVYLDGIRQLETSHYAEDGDLKGVTFTFSPATGDEIRFDYEMDAAP